MNPKKILHSAWEGLMLNKVRSFLTTLGGNYWGRLSNYHVGSKRWNRSCNRRSD